MIRDLLFNEKNTYGAFLDWEEKIATNILADRLNLLEMADLISKKRHPDSNLFSVSLSTDEGVENKIIGVCSFLVIVEDCTNSLLVLGPRSYTDYKSGKDGDLKPDSVQH